MKDPYLYDDVPVLKNKYGIKNQKELDLVESNKVIAKLMTVDRLLKENDTIDFSYMKKIHKHLLGDIYEFAGENRTVWMQKKEAVLYGLSVEYAAPNMIDSVGKATIQKMDSIPWNQLSIEECTEKFSKLIAALWQDHPFREGNTRTTMTFASHYAIKHGFSLNRQNFKDSSKYTRDSLVLASIGSYSENQNLERIMKDSITQGDSYYFKKKLLEANYKPTDKMIDGLKNINRFYGKDVSIDEIKSIWKDRKNCSENEVAVIQDTGKEIMLQDKRRENFLER